MAVAWEIAPKSGGPRELYPTKEAAIEATGSLYRHRWHGPTEVEGDFVFVVWWADRCGGVEIKSVHRTYAMALTAADEQALDEITVLELTP